MKSFFVFPGTPYEMGYAHGELMKEKANSMMNAVWEYLEDQVVRIHKKGGRGISQILLTG